MTLEKSKPRGNEPASGFQKERLAILLQWGLLKEQVDVDSLNSQEAHKLIDRAMGMTEELIALFPPDTVIQFPDDPVYYTIKRYTVRKGGKLQNIYFSGPDGSIKNTGSTKLFEVTVVRRGPLIADDLRQLTERIRAKIGPVMDGLHNRGVVTDSLNETRKAAVAVFLAVYQEVEVTDDLIVQKINKHILRNYNIELS